MVEGVPSDQGLALAETGQDLCPGREREEPPRLLLRASPEGGPTARRSQTRRPICQPDSVREGGLCGLRGLLLGGVELAARAAQPEEGGKSDRPYSLLCRVLF